MRHPCTPPHAFKGRHRRTPLAAHCLARSAPFHRIADIGADLAGGGTIEVAPWTAHLLAGISLSF